MLVEAAWAATKAPGPLHAFFVRIRARRGHQIAAVAVARKLTVLCWHLLTKGEDYLWARPALVATGTTGTRPIMKGVFIRKNLLCDSLGDPPANASSTKVPADAGPSTRDQITVHEGRTTCTTVDNSKAERWTYWQDGNNQETQNFQFTTPNEADPGARCGKVVFSDMHVSADSSSAPGTPYPNGCSTNPLTPQEKALAFMFFDIASCVGPVF